MMNQSATVLTINQTRAAEQAAVDAGSSFWQLMETAGGLFWFSVSVFVLAWIGQFIGHHIEGKKPSFLQDVQFLLIGPAWLMAFVYRKLGIPI